MQHTDAVHQWRMGSTILVIAASLWLAACSRPTSPDAREFTRAVPVVNQPSSAADQPASRVDQSASRLDQPAASQPQSLTAAQEHAAPLVSEADGTLLRQQTTLSAADKRRYRPAVERWLPSPPVVPVPRGQAEQYASFDDNATIATRQQPVSTFSIDVDTGAYSNTRRFLQAGQLPPVDAVRVEELLNYFDYAYPRPPSSETPFSLITEIGPTPWNAHTRLLHIGLQGFVPEGQRPAANLVFLVDVSGSMASPNKLGLLKSSIRLMTRQLDHRDRVSMVVYAGASGVVLEPTPGNAQRTIEQALNALEAGGSTNGEAGIELAYQMAERHLQKSGVNRVILATDGDFNVGLSDTQALIDLIETKRQSGIALSTLGFGAGNLNDQLMEQLADHGNGHYAYIDTLAEANKVLVEELSATLLAIAQDVKVQVEFNPAVVSEYRLIGYVNRALANEDFDDDRVDAGEIGAGHSVTALYELALVGAGGERITPLRYGRETSAGRMRTELGELRLRYKRPGQPDSQLLTHVLRADSVLEELDATSDNYRFAAAVAAFGQHLRRDTRLGDFSLDQVESLARDGRGTDHDGYRAGFVTLVALAAGLQPEPTARVWPDKDQNPQQDPDPGTGGDSNG